MKAKLETARILSNTCIAKDIYTMVLLSPGIVEAIEKPGQFINLYPKEKHTLLPRPISISQFDREKQTLTVIYAVVGDGTQQFSHLLEGDSLQISGPMGNGFTLPEKAGDYVIVGGGIGVPPLLGLAQKLKGNLTVILGFRHEPILVKEFETLGATVYVATEDGNVGHKGNVIDILKDKKITGQMVFSCGPKPMLKALNTWCQEKDIPVQVSLEERMACGIGVCVGCVCKQQDPTEADGWAYKKTCSDGPVFMGSEVIWDE